MRKETLPVYCPAIPEFDHLDPTQMFKQICELSVDPRIVGNDRKRAVAQMQSKLLPAYRFTKNAYTTSEHPMRDNGIDETITHSEAVALFLIGVGIIHKDAILAAFNHDVPEDTRYNLAQVRRIIGKRAAGIVFAESKVVGKDKMTDHARTHKKLFDAYTKDSLVGGVKIADVTHNAGTIPGKNPEKERAYCRLALRVFEPFAKRIGLAGLARIIGDYAIEKLQPTVSKLLRKAQSRIVNEKTLRKLSMLTGKWIDESYFVESEAPLKYQSIEIEKLPVYEMYKRLPSGMKLATVDDVPKSIILPRVKIICHDDGNLFRWHKFLSKKYTQSGDNHLDLNGSMDGKKLLRIPIKIKGRLQQIEVELSTQSLEIMPVHKDVFGFDNLTSHEKFVAEQKFAAFVAEYRKIQRGKKGAAEKVSAVNEFTETLVRDNMIVVLDKDRNPHHLPADARLLDVAYSIGQRLGNDAISVEVKRGRSRYAGANLTDTVSPGIRVKFGTARNQQIVPSRFDQVTTERAIDAVKTALISHRYAEKVRTDAWLRGTKILLWLYENKTGSAPDIHLVNGFDSVLKQNFDTLDDFKIALGMAALPALPKFYTRWINQEVSTDDFQIVSCANKLIANLSEIRRNKYTMRIHIEDQIGVLEKLGEFTRETQASILPISGKPDHFVRGTSPTIIEAVFEIGNQQQVNSVKSKLEEFYRQQGLNIEILPPEKEK